MVLVFKIFLIMLKWELISLPVIIIVIVAFPNLINVQVYLITIILLTVLDIAILGRLTSKYLQKHNRLERLSNVYVLNNLANGKIINFIASTNSTIPAAIITAFICVFSQ